MPQKCLSQGDRQRYDYGFYSAAAAKPLLVCHSPGIVACCESHAAAAAADGLCIAVVAADKPCTVAAVPVDFAGPCVGGVAGNTVAADVAAAAALMSSVAAFPGILSLQLSAG